MASTGYFKICPKCYRKYGRHFLWCLDCTPIAKPNSDGVYPPNTCQSRWGIYTWQDKVYLHFCCSRELQLDKRLQICDKCKAKFKCYTQTEDI